MMNSKLLVVTNSYKKVVSPDTLQICNKDGEAMKAVFEGKFEVQCEENVHTGVETRAKIDQFVAGCKDEPLHTVYFYFSGHGGNTTAQPPGYKKTQGDVIYADNGKDKILIKEIMQKICKINAKHKVFLYDCCRGHRTQGCLDFIFARNLDEEIGEDIIHEEERHTWIFKAATPYHVALAKEHPSRKISLFTGLFLDALEQLKAQTDGESTDETESVNFTTIDQFINKKYKTFLKDNKYEGMGCALEKWACSDMDVAIP